MKNFIKKIKYFFKIFFAFLDKKCPWLIPSLEFYLEIFKNKFKNFKNKLKVNIEEIFPWLLPWLDRKIKEDWKPLYRHKKMQVGVSYRFQIHRLSKFFSKYKKIKDFFVNFYLLLNNPDLTFVQNVRLLIYKSKNRLRFLIKQKYREYHLAYTNWYYIWAFEWDRFFGPIRGILNIFYDMLTDLVFSQRWFVRSYKLIVIFVIFGLCVFFLILFWNTNNIFFILMSLNLNVERLFGLFLVLCFWVYILFVVIIDVFLSEYNKISSDIEAGKTDVSQIAKDFYSDINSQNLLTPKNYLRLILVILSTLFFGVLFLLFFFGFEIYIYHWVHFYVSSGKNVPLVLDFYFVRFERTWFFKSELLENLKVLLEHYPEAFSKSVNKELIVRESHNSLSTMKENLADLFQHWQRQEDLRNAIIAVAVLIGSSLFIAIFFDFF